MTPVAESKESPAPAPVKPPKPPYDPREHIPPECIPDVTQLVIEDGKPVDGTKAEKQMRVLTAPLEAAWQGPGEGGPFSVFANVGLFHTYRESPIVPDVMLAADVHWPSDLSDKENQSYFLWIVGKVPDVVIEIVSNREGGEDTDKLLAYARIGIPYYLIFDPEDHLRQGVLRIYRLQGRVRKRYQLVEDPWLEEVDLGVRLWEGEYAGITGVWLRWYDRSGDLVPLGAELARQLDEEKRRAELERQRADDLQRQLDELRRRLDKA